MHPFDLVPPALEQGLLPLAALTAVHVPEDHPYARARILLLAAAEQDAVDESALLSMAFASQDTRRDLALVRHVDARQRATLAALWPSGGDFLQRGLIYALLSLDLCAVLAQRLSDGPLRQGLHFALPEFQDELYRLANLMMLIDNTPAQQLLQGYAEIMPGRPLIACHRHPYDEVRTPLTSDADVFSRLVPRLLRSLCRAKEAFYLQAAGEAETKEARGLYLELSLLAQQHATHFGSLMPQCAPMLQLLDAQYLEAYLYDSCAREEESAAMRQLFLEERDHELAHLHKLCALAERESGVRPTLSAFPDPLRLGPSKGYVRDILQSVGLTAQREQYVPVGQLPQGADFFRYQQLLCGQEDAPSHQVVARLIAQTGSDYRFEIAPHPIDALQNRQRDNTQVGR